MKAQRARPLVLLCFLILLLPAAKALATESVGKKMIKLDRDGLAVFYEAQMVESAREVLKAYPSARRAVSEALLWDVDFSLEVVLVKDQRDFRSVTGNSVTVAYADSGRGVIVIDGTSINTKPFTLEATLRHELCHLVLGSHIEGDRLPRWLNEGVCQWASGGVAEVMGLGGKSQISGAALFGSLIPLSKLHRDFPRERKKLLLAYEEGLSAVQYIVSKHGRRGLHAILVELKSGKEIDGAIEGVLGVTFDEFESRWQANLIRQHTWLTFAAGNIYEILFLIAALVTLLGFIRIYIKIKSYRDEDDFTEED